MKSELVLSAKTVHPSEGQSQSEFASELSEAMRHVLTEVGAWPSAGLAGVSGQAALVAARLAETTGYSPGVPAVEVAANAFQGHLTVKVEPRAMLLPLLAVEDSPAIESEPLFHQESQDSALCFQDRPRHQNNQGRHPVTKSALRSTPHTFAEQCRDVAPTYNTQQSLVTHCKVVA